MTLALFLGVLFFAILAGLPVAFALPLSSMVLMLHLDTFSPDILAQGLINGVDNFPLLAMTMVGHRRGGLGYVAVLTAIVLA